MPVLLLSLGGGGVTELSEPAECILLYWELVKYLFYPCLFYIGVLFVFL